MNVDSAKRRKTLVAEVGLAVEVDDQGHARPEEEVAYVGVAASGDGKARVVEVERDDLRIRPGAGEGREVAAAGELVRAPHHLPLPEYQRHLACDDQSAARPAPPAARVAATARAEIAALRPM